MGVIIQSAAHFRRMFSSWSDIVERQEAEREESERDE